MSSRSSSPPSLPTFDSSRSAPLPPGPIHLVEKLPRPHRLLYAGDLVTNSTSDFRVRALHRLGQHIESFDTGRYHFRDRVRSSLQRRLLFEPWIHRPNRDLLAAVERLQPQIVFFDKPILFTPHTLARIHDTGAKMIFYMQDSPFGPRHDGCWRQFHRGYRMADLHCLFRAADLPRYRAWGLPFLKILFSYEPSILFPPPPDWSDVNRDRGLSYIGHTHEDRPAFLIQLAERFRLPLAISGTGWRRKLNPAQQNKYLRGDYLGGPAYRDTIWRSKINLSFVTAQNEDDIAHKSMEIAAAGGFLLALRTEGHRACFEEDREAVFFSSLEECAQKAAYYLDHADEREAIARRGCQRAIASGYSNDTQLARVLNYFG